MTTRHYATELSDYLDGDLGPEERAELEAHLADCPACAGTLAELRIVVDAAARAPELPPEHDLWPGIEARLSPRSERRDRVIDLASRRRVIMTVPQLLAAGLALILFSAGAVWLAVGGRGETSAESAVALTSPVTTVAFTDLDRTIAALEQEYVSRRDELDPETIRVVERNLAIIDRAIGEAREALAGDPSSAFLSSHLAGTMRRKMDLLRQAAVIAQTEI